MKCMHCVVAGLVQGVGFRAATQREAMRLGVKGWVRNTSAGTVEVAAQAEPPVWEQFHAWLQSGPRSARVDSLDIQVRDCYEEFLRFEVRPTE